MAVKSGDSTGLPTALTIAGSDSGGGAGIQADLKTFAAHGVYGTSAITAVTAQNTIGVSGIHVVPDDFVTAQVEAVVSDLGCDAVKTGMLANSTIVEAVAAAVEALELPNLVVDPVMLAKSGDPLLDEEAVHALRWTLLRLARVVTPNIPEAEVLAKMSIGSLADMREAATRIAMLKPAAVVIKGGHLPGPEIVDVLLADGEFHEFVGPRIEGPQHARDGLHVRIRHCRAAGQGRRSERRGEGGEKLRRRRHAARHPARQGAPAAEPLLARLILINTPTRTNRASGAPWV